MKQSRRIFIVGHPGAGKAVFGKALAEKLGWTWVDADFGFEAKIGRTLQTLCGKAGEESFLRGETELLQALIHRDQIVVTTDASIVCNAENRDLLSFELTVYLQVSVPLQMERLIRHAEPLLPVGSKKEFLEELHQQRDALNEKVAKIIVNSDDSALDAHVARVVSLVGLGNAKPDQESLTEKDMVIFHKNLHIPVHLSSQQAFCLKLLAEGKSSKEIAKEMHISFRTVEGCIARTLEQSGCASSKELIALYHAQAIS